jgi:hypothetical protein
MAHGAGSERIVSAGAEDTPSPLAGELDRIARWGLWALPVWAVLLFLATLTHQPDTRTDFAGFARYVTTTEFLVSHVVASIVGAGIGVLGLLALFTFLALRVRSRPAAAGLALAVVGDVMLTAVFGLAAFGQSAVGRLYVAGHTAEAVAIYDDMYGAPLSATAAAGVLLLVIGVVVLGIAVARSRVLPGWAGIGMAVGIVVFGVIGVILADVVQSVGAALLIASTLWLASSPRRTPAASHAHRV